MLVLDGKTSEATSEVSKEVTSTPTGETSAESGKGQTPGTTTNTQSDSEAIAKQARAEAIKERKAREAAESELAELKKAQMTDVEKKEARLKELEAANSVSIERVIKAELRVAAMKAGIDPELAGDLALANKSVREMIKFENGEVSGIEEALKELQSRYTILAAKSDKAADEGDKSKGNDPGVRINATNPGASGNNGRPSDEQINKMSREELKANWGKIFK